LKIVDSDEPEYLLERPVCGRNFDQGTSLRRGFVPDRFLTIFTSGDNLCNFRTRLSADVGVNSKLFGEGRATELGVRLYWWAGDSARSLPFSDLVGVLGAGMFASVSGDVGAVESNPGVVKGLLEGVRAVCNDVWALLALLAARSNQSRRSLTGVLGLVSVPIRSSPLVLLKIPFLIVSLSPPLEGWQLSSAASNGSMTLELPEPWWPSSDSWDWVSDSGSPIRLLITFISIGASLFAALGTGHGVPNVSAVAPELRCSISWKSLAGWSSSPLLLLLKGMGNFSSCLVNGGGRPAGRGFKAIGSGTGRM
jgi:hypothetical protein